MMYRFQIQKYILSEVFRVYEPQEPLTFEPYLHVGMTFKKFTHFLNKKLSSRPYIVACTLPWVTFKSHIKLYFTY